MSGLKEIHLPWLLWPWFRPTLQRFGLWYSVRQPSCSHLGWGPGWQGPRLLVSCLWSTRGPQQTSAWSRQPPVSLPEARPSCFPPPGTAVRHCDEHRGWLLPNLFNCTSVTFSELKGFVREPSHLLAPYPPPAQEDSSGKGDSGIPALVSGNPHPYPGGHLSPFLSPFLQSSSSSLWVPHCHPPGLTPVPPCPGPG